jgi:hypothetical protein
MWHPLKNGEEPGRELGSCARRGLAGGKSLLCHKCRHSHTRPCLHCFMLYACTHRLYLESFSTFYHCIYAFYAFYAWWFISRNRGPLQTSTPWPGCQATTASRGRRRFYAFYAFYAWWIHLSPGGRPHEQKVSLCQYFLFFSVLDF